MLKGLVGAIGRFAGGAARASGESMEIASQVPEAVAPAAKAIETAPQVPSNIINFTEKLEARAKSGKGGPRLALHELSEKSISELNENEEPNEEKKEKPQEEGESMLAKTVGAAMEGPQVNQSPIKGLQSRTLEELPEAIGETPDNLPRSS